MGTSTVAPSLGELAFLEKSFKMGKNQLHHLPRMALVFSRGNPSSSSMRTDSGDASLTEMRRGSSCGAFHQSSTLFLTGVAEGIREVVGDLDLSTTSALQTLRLDALAELEFYIGSVEKRAKQEVDSFRKVLDMYGKTTAQSTTAQDSTDAEMVSVIADVIERREAKKDEDLRTLLTAHARLAASGYDWQAHLEKLLLQRFVGVLQTEDSGAFDRTTPLNYEPLFDMRVAESPDMNIVRNDHMFFVSPYFAPPSFLL